MTERSRARCVVPAVLYFVVLLPGDTTLVLVLVALLVSFPAFIYLLVNRPGGSSLLGIAVMLIPFVGALVALLRLLQRSSARLLFGAACWAYPLMILGTGGSERFLLSSAGALALFVALSYVPAFRSQPLTTCVFFLALPATLFILISALVLPFVAATSDVDLAEVGGEEGDWYADTGGDWASSEVDYFDRWDPLDGDLQAPTWQEGPDLSTAPWHAASAHELHDPFLNPPSSPLTDPSVFEAPGEWDAALLDSQTHSPQHWPSEIGQPTIQESIHGPDSADSGSGEVPDPTAEVELLGQVESVRFDGITGDPTLETGAGDVHLTHSDVTDRLYGSLPDGGRVEVWSSPVTGDVHVAVGDEVARFHFDPTTGSWVSTDAAGTFRLSHDTVTGDVRFESPNASTTFRYDPITGRVISQ